MEDILQNTVLFHMPQVDGILKTGIIKVIVFPVSADLVRYEIGYISALSVILWSIILGVSHLSKKRFADKGGTRW